MRDFVDEGLVCLAAGPVCMSTVYHRRVGVCVCVLRGSGCCLQQILQQAACESANMCSIDGSD